MPAAVVIEGEEKVLAYLRDSIYPDIEADTVRLGERLPDSYGAVQLVAYLEVELDLGFVLEHLKPENFDSARTIAKRVHRAAAAKENRAALYGRDLAV